MQGPYREHSYYVSLAASCFQEVDCSLSTFTLCSWSSTAGRHRHLLRLVETWDAQHLCWERVLATCVERWELLVVLWMAKKIETMWTSFVNCRILCKETSTVSGTYWPPSKKLCWFSLKALEALVPLECRKISFLIMIGWNSLTVAFFVTNAVSYKMVGLANLNQSCCRERCFGHMFGIKCAVRWGETE